jgi:hypothetical protein
MEIDCIHCCVVFVMRRESLARSEPEGYKPRTTQVLPFYFIPTKISRTYTMPAKCKQRERILASGAVDVPTLPLGAVRGVLCFRCFEPVDKVLKCGACRRAGYCSQACQKLDWTAGHKKQCKVMKAINEEDIKDYSDRRTWADYRRVLVTSNAFSTLAKQLLMSPNRYVMVI